MAPILILQNNVADGPSYLATWLQRQGVAMDVRCSERGEAFPAGMAGFGALAILGGEMSVNDPLPELRRAEDLIRQSMAAGLPVIGHCLGGQLMARALGATVGASPAPEIGWTEVAVDDTAVARDWLGDAPLATVFEWHYEAFDLPVGAQHLAGSAHCPNQAFALGRHLAMQFHVELDEPKLNVWLDVLDKSYAEVAQRHPESIQSVAAMRAAQQQHLRAQQQMADRLYARWLAGAV